MKPDDARKLTWENFEVGYLRPGLPAAIPVLGVPPVLIFVDDGGRRIGLRAEMVDSEQLPPADLAAIQVVEVAIGGTSYVEASTSAVGLFRPFYAFCLAVADEIQEGKIAASLALARSLRAWRQLFRDADVLSEEAEVGLLGELWFLRELITARGGVAVEAWTGPRREAHDFRIGTHEFEVKSSRTENHTHVINGISQLVPSPDHILHVVSVAYAVAGYGGGQSLGMAVAATRDALSDAVQLGRFDELLDLAGYRDQDAERYRTQWQVRGLPRLVAVDNSFPRLTPSMLDSIGPLRQRIGDVTYAVTLEGLGEDTASAGYAKTIRS